MGRNEEPDVLTWTVWPVATHRGRGLSVLAVVVACIYAAFTWGGLGIGIFAVLVLVGGVGPFFVRTRYRLTPGEVSVSSPFQRVRRPWKDFRRAYVEEHGVSLSPFRKRHFLEPYRSIMLRYGDHQDEILDWVGKFGPEEMQEGKRK